MHDKIVNFYGLQRSGLHAIVGWALAGLGEEQFDNNLRLKYFYEGIQNPTRRVRLFERPYPEGIERYAAEHPDELHFTIIRDVYNWAASRTAYKNKHPRSHSMLKGLRKKYRPYLFKTLEDNWNNGVVVINFNTWMVDPQYRIDRAEKIGFETDGAPHTKIIPGNLDGYYGSSFTGCEYKDNAHEQDLFNRYKLMINDPAFLRLNLWRGPILNATEKVFGIAPPPELAAIAWPDGRNNETI